jgi:hypothetical protein
MNRPETDAVFGGSVPETHDRYLVPRIFESYADDLAGRLGEATQVATAAIERGFGTRDIDGRIRGYVVTAKR